MKENSRKALLLFLVFATTSLFWTTLSRPLSPEDSTAVSRGKTVILGRFQGPIGPVTNDYFTRLLNEAKAQEPACIIITMDTPGGLDVSMRSIIKQIFASPIPIVVFVYPSGARAASAGALITLAAHVSAMAPGTNIGAAHPVAIGSGKMDEEMLEKVTNDAAAYARGIARKRNRNAEWAEKIVRESISSTAEEAKESGVIEIIADDVDNLLAKLDGKKIKINNQTITLSLDGAEVIEREPTWREKLLAKISDPNIAYLLMLLGIFGIFFELQNPGAIFPGVVGVIAIVLAFFALQLLPVNYTGLALIILAIIFFVLEIKIPSGGLLTVGGVVSMVIGSIMFINSPLPFMRVSITVIVPAVIFTALFFLFAVGMGIKAQRKRVATGAKGIVGEMGIAKTNIGDKGSVFVHGEYWNASSGENIPAGTQVIVVSIRGMNLKVKPYKSEEAG